MYHLNGLSDRAYYYRHPSLDCEEYTVCYLGYGKVMTCPPGWQIDVRNGKCSLVCNTKGRYGILRRRHKDVIVSCITTRLVVQQLARANSKFVKVNKKISNLSITGPKWGESTGDRRIPLTKGQ